MGTFQLIGRSDAHRELLAKLERVAGTDAEILISGPTGVGKELYARHAHEKSWRGHRAFVPVNCGAIPTELLENELFGHRDGAFTSARESQEGLAAEADGGTLFLDEVDTLSLAGQVKLLRFIQQKEYRRLGDSRIRKADVRFIAATNSDLPALVNQGRFRGDLFYRLCVIPVSVPALRYRRDDIDLLLDSFATQYSELYRLPKFVLSPGAMQALLDHAWPGNVRELENCVKYLTCLQLARPVDKFDLPMAPAARMVDRRHANFDAELLKKPFTRARTDVVTDFEKRYVAEALRQADGNITLAASQCGEYRKKISRLIKKHGLLPSELGNANESA